MGKPFLPFQDSTGDEFYIVTTQRNSMEERRAVAQLKQGEIRGLESLVGKYYVQTVRTAFLITRDRPLAEDLVQSALTK